MKRIKGDICIINKDLHIVDTSHPNGIIIPVNTRLIIDAITDKYLCCTLESDDKVAINLVNEYYLTTILDNKKINKFKTELLETRIQKAIDNSVVGGIGVINPNLIKLDLNNCSYKEIEDERNELIHADDHGVKLVYEEIQYLKELTAEFVRRGGIIEDHYNPSKIVRTQIFTIKCEHQEDGGFIMTRRNDGFNIHELMGVISFTQQEICKQLTEEIKPDVIKREVIID